MTELGIVPQVNIYTEHARSSDCMATPVTYVEVKNAEGVTWWGVGMCTPTLDASLRAVLSAANRTVCS